LAGKSKPPIGKSDLTIGTLRRQIANAETELAWLRTELSAKMFIAFDADRHGMVPRWAVRRRSTAFTFDPLTP
jgi:hypothetical protein